MALSTYVKEFFGRVQLVMKTSAASQIDVLAETDGTPKVSNYGKAGATLTAFKVETTGEQDNVVHGKDAGGTIDPLRTNTNQQLQVEIVGTTKVLGQSAPLAATETVLYTVPAAKVAKVHTLWLLNRDAVTALTLDVGVSVGGGALANVDYILKGLPMGPSEFVVIDGNPLLTLAAADEIRINASTATATVSLYGFEGDN